MQHTVQIDQQKSMERGLTATQAITFDFITKAPLWATVTTIDWVAWWRFDVSKMPKQLPMVSDKKNTFNVIIIQLLKLELLERLVIGGRDAYFKITEKWKTRNCVSFGGWIESTHHWNKSMVHWIESTQGWNKSIVKKNDSAWKAESSTIEINQPAISYNTNNNNLISTNKSNIDSSKVIISNETEKEILTNENKKNIEKYLKHYRETLEKFWLVYVWKRVKGEKGEVLTDAVAMSNIMRDEPIQAIMANMKRTVENFIESILTEAIKDKYYITRITSVRGFREVRGEVFNKTAWKNYSKPLSSMIAI